MATTRVIGVGEGEGGRGRGERRERYGIHDGERVFEGNLQLDGQGGLKGFRRVRGIGIVAAFFLVLNVERVHDERHLQIEQTFGL